LSSFSQVYEVSFSEYVGFNTGDLNKYEDVIDSTNYVRSWDHFGSVNKYVVNLTNKTVERYYDGKLSKSTTIVTSKKVGDLIYLTINDEENFTGNESEDKAKIVSVIASFDSWLSANPNMDDAQFNWRLFEFCIMNDDKARAATALQAAVDKGKTFDDGALEASRARIA
jgi:hypothetical protein